ncbi:MAG: TonB-dependent receptor [Acidobacteria bacterium]|nr:TonB-dependent receptor [Acidobacteriota bacterium]
MYKLFKFISMSLFAAICFTTIGFGQETTGIIEITTKDNTGAIVPGVTVTVSNAGGTSGFKRTVTTNGSGFQRILQVPPGNYNVKAEATSGFAEKSFKNIIVVLGKATPINLVLSVGTVDAVVDITAGDNANIDTTDTKIQTNITSEIAERLPKGTNFASLLKVSPATRPEAKSGGYQIDGASGSENTFVVDGNEVTNAISGTLDSNNNLPFSLVQEVQIKSSGFEAEYGGATGGVINVVTKGGNNEFRGDFGLSFRPGKLQAADRDILVKNPLGAAQHLSSSGIDTTNGFFPSATFSGPVLKDRIWFLGSWSPQYLDNERTIPYATMSPVTYRSTQKNEYGFARLDGQPLESLRFSGTYVWNPIAVQGTLPGIASQFDSNLPNDGILYGTEYTDQRGGRQNSNIVTASGVWTPSSNVVVSGRYGRNFLNNVLGTYGISSIFPYTSSNSRILISSTSGAPPAGANGGINVSNGVNLVTATVYDATVRETYDFDGTYLFTGLGRHELKGGYQRNSIRNDVLAPRSGYIILYYSDANTDSGIDKKSGRSVTPTPGNIGSGQVITFGAQGGAASTNDGIYFQDKWQPTNRLTLNLGFRIEKEEVPSFNEFPAIEFGWGDKIAPRIGGAFDLTGDGKTKVSAFFGWFYDRFKYELPRGSFGGNIYYSNYFELFDPNKDFRTYDPSAIIGGAQTIVVGGVCPQTGFAFADVRCSIDRRVPSNDPSLDIAEQGGVDPNIKAYRQTELTFTFERELSSNYLFAARYTRKNLDRAVEDAGFVTASGSEAYIIGNPGLGLIKEFYEQNGWTPVKAKREYNALEIRLNRRFADDYYFNANYTWSRLWGNYSGLASSDEEGRTDPNVSRAFDAPFTEACVCGGETVGLLATDRPHVFKFAAAYNVDWKKRFGMGEGNSTEFKTFFNAQSGTPLTTFVDVAGYNNIILNGRGDLGRTDFLTQTDFGISHRYKFGRDERFTAVFDLDVINIFNQNAVTDRFNNSDTTNSYDLTDPANGLVTMAEANSLASGPLTALAEKRFQASGAPNIANFANAQTPDVRYKLAENFQGPRSIRFGFRFMF